MTKFSAWYRGSLGLVTVCLWLPLHAEAQDGMQAKIATVLSDDFNQVKLGDYLKLLDLSAKVIDAEANAINAKRKYQREYPALSRYEGDDVAWEGFPRVPEACSEMPVTVSAARKTACSECFSKAQTALRGVQIRLERNRRIYRSGMAYLTGLVDAGTAFAGAGGIAALTMINDLKAMKASQTQVRQAYDDAYKALMKELSDALDDVSECEREAFNNKSWYDRYGFILYQSFEANYRRND
jgi:hypothetical protein